MAKTSKKLHPAVKGSAKLLSRSKRLRARHVIAIYGILICLSALAAILIVMQMRPPMPLADPFNSHQRTAAGITLYYPARLPTGYRLDTASLDSIIQNSVVTFRIFDSNGGSIDISEQRPPAGFNFDTFYHSLDNTITFKTALGQVISGSIDEGKTNLSNLVTADNTWVLLRTASVLPQKDIKVIFEHLAVSR